jgi:hypothetical protein
MQKLDMKTVAIGIKSEFDLIKLSEAASSFLAICQTFKHENINISGKAGLLYYNILAVSSNVSFCRAAKRRGDYKSRHACYYNFPLIAIVSGKNGNLLMCN